LSRQRPSRAQHLANRDAAASRRIQALERHLAVMSKIMAADLHRTATGSRLFDGFFKDLADDARALLNEDLRVIEQETRGVSWSPTTRRP